MRAAPHVADASLPAESATAMEFGEVGETLTATVKSPSWFCEMTN